MPSAGVVSPIAGRRRRPAPTTAWRPGPRPPSPWGTVTTKVGNSVTRNRPKAGNFATVDNAATAPAFPAPSAAAPASGSRSRSRPPRLRREHWNLDVERLALSRCLAGSTQSVQTVAQPCRRRTVRVTRPRDPRGQRRDLLTGTRTERQRALRQRHGLQEHPEHARRSRRRTGNLQDPRQSQAQGTESPRIRWMPPRQSSVCLTRRRKGSAPAWRAPTTRRPSSG